MNFFGKSPFRISFYGGGTDIEPYPSEYEGCCISHSINIGCFASIDLNVDKKIIENLNFKTKYIFENNKKNDNLFKIFNLSKKNFNYHLKYFFELNTGSGLGSSGSFISLLSSFINKIEGKSFSKYRIANKAYFYEKKILETSGGRQDEFASVFGGFNFIQFKKKNITTVKKLKPSFKFKKELQKKSLLIFTGMNRDGSKIIDNHIKIYNKNQNIKLLHEIKNLTLEAKNYVKNNDIENFILKINKYWDLKKEFNPNVTNNKIDKFIDIAKENGAYSAKLLGAGNGGHLLIFCEENEKKKIIKKLEKYGCSARDFYYQESGLNIS
jgi:D-glycero-alpha-D-manno-heptose-7-phosphate kinase